MTQAGRLLKRLSESLTLDEFEDNWRNGHMFMPVSVLRDLQLLDPSEIGYRDRSLPFPTRSGARVSVDTASYIDNLKKQMSGGLEHPIALDVTDRGKLIIIDGTHRLLAAEELGWKHVPVEFVPAAVDNGMGYKFAREHGAFLE